jgi:hypothetical protein
MVNPRHEGPRGQLLNMAYAAVKTAKEPIRVALEKLMVFLSEKTVMVDFRLLSCDNCVQ